MVACEDRHLSRMTILNALSVWSTRIERVAQSRFIHEINWARRRTFHVLNSSHEKFDVWHRPYTINPKRQSSKKKHWPCLAFPIAPALTPFSTQWPSPYINRPVHNDCIKPDDTFWHYLFDPHMLHTNPGIPTCQNVLVFLRNCILPASSERHAKIWARDLGQAKPFPNRPLS